eukprot:Nk52_evm10s578 gene=Nk52_evmTU10s578
MIKDKKNVQVAVVGGGLVGALNACYFAKRGYKVDVYEFRKDIRQQKHYAGKSINLAMSERAIEALEGVGLAEKVKEKGIPMHARMIHGRDGSRSAIPYGTAEQHLYSVDRRLLNEVLLNEAEKISAVNFHFEHKLESANFDSGKMVFNVSGSAVSTDDLTGQNTVDASADLIVGCDGAFSAVRKLMMKRPRFNYQQEYIPHGYKELTMPPTKDGDWCMETNYLHIWPRNEFMMIALPNQDKTFTLTLFMPFDIFETITTEEDVMKFFETNFPDAIPLIGKKLLLKDYFQNPTSALVSVKCSPYHVNDKAVIMGDAAHAMVPFYGQGMNAGFEDCSIFNRILNKFDDDFGQSIKEFSETRKEDAHAICDLAMYNYVEMRSSVNSKWFLFRKHVDNILHRIFPNTFIPLYTMVAFTRIPYATVVRSSSIQSKLVDRGIFGLSVFSIFALVLAGRRLLKGKF